MEMSPQRVRDVEFKSVRKGVDPDEVRHFLNDVADELERTQNQSAAMEARARAAVARLQEVSEPAGGSASPDQAPAVTVVASVDESETISRTLLLAQRTADTAVAEARADAAQIVRSANDEAATTLDSTREMAAQLVVEARNEARVAGESERVTVAGEVESLKARRDFLESDVEQLEIFLADQRSRIRESATSLLEITDRVPGGLGDARRPLLSASDDDDGHDADDTAGTTVAASMLSQAPTDTDGDIGHAGDDRDDDDLLIVTDLADEPSADEPPAAEAGDDGSAAPVSLDDDPWSDQRNDPTKAMPMVDTSDVEGEQRPDDDFRFSFDDDRG